MNEYVYNYCLRLLNLRQYSKFELKRKISQKFPEFHDFDILFSMLEDGHLINDDEFTESYTLSGIKRGWGRRKIALKLKEKGIDLNENSLNNFDYSFIISEVKRRFRFPLSKSEHEKVKRFLLQRGFTFEELDKIIGKAREGRVEM